MLKFEAPYLLLINGKQGSGKSYFLKWMIREQSLGDKPFDFGVVFTNTAFEGSFEYIPKKYIYEKFDPKVVDNLMKIQAANVKKKIEKRAFIILDDCLDDTDQWNSECMKKLSTQLRHYNISLIITTQYCHLVPPRIRSNCMYSVFFDCGPGRRETEAIFNAYGARFRNFEEFKTYYYANIKDHKFVCYDKETDEYKTYRCPEKIPNFRIKYNKKI